MVPAPLRFRRPTLIVTALALASTLSIASGQTAPTFFPSAAGKNVNPDSPLRITFVSPPTIGSGKILVCDAADDTIVATVDAAQSTRTQSIGGLASYIVRPIMIRDNQAAIILPPHSLAYGKTYYVRFDGPALAGGGADLGATFGSDKHWQFSTKAAPPAAEAVRLIVAADGTGDFTTIQGAIDFLPEGNKTPRQIFIRSGTYEEIVCAIARDNLTFLGEDRKKTIIAYANNERFNPNAGGNPFATGAPIPSTVDPKVGPVYRRGVFLAHRVSDLTIANLTIHNTTPRGGSQAETIILNVSPDAGHVILANLDLYSFQDTFQFNGQTYMTNSYVEGDGDFMWGTGPSYFQNIHACGVNRGGTFITVRNPATNRGFVYKDCAFDALVSENVIPSPIARAEAGRFPTSEVVLLNASMTNAISPQGWLAPTGGSAAQIHYWEYNSHTPDGKPIDLSRRQATAKKLSDDIDKEIIANYSDPAWVLNNGGIQNASATTKWTPALAPLIASSPTATTAKLGAKVTLTVQAVGVPAVTYQWQKNGSDVPGASQPDLTFESAAPTDAGSYVVTVTNTGGKATSTPARLMVAR